MVSARQKVAFYGDSLVLAGVKLSLGAYPFLEVITVDHSCAISERELCELQAAVIIFDLAAVDPSFPLTLHRKQPGLVLIGLDSAGDNLLLLFGQQAHSLDTDQLVQMITALP